ncbi:HlyD family secretion protein [Caminibacter sp.]
MKKYGIFAVIGVLIIVSAYFIYKKLNPKTIPPYLVAGVGRIDGDLIALNTKYPGRVKVLRVDMGDSVKKGELLAVISSKETEDKLKALNQEIKAKEYELNFTTSKIENTIKKAKLNIKAKEAEIKGVEAEINAIKKVIAQDRKDEIRIARLVKKNLAKEHELELAKLKTKTDTDKLKGLLAKKEALNVALEAAKKDLNIALASKNNIDALKKGIDALKAKKAAVEAVLEEMKLHSPINGYVDSKVANVGEVVGAGMPVVLLINPSSFYLKMYVNEIDNGKIKIGDKAEIFLDAFPNKGVPAVVSKIAKKAEFTPKEVEVRSDRITRVYEVRLKPLKPCKYFKLGLPAIGVIKIGNGKLPESLNELPPL